MKNRVKVMFQPKYFRKAANIETNCAGSIFWNKGTSIAIVSGCPLAPGEFFVLDVNQDEIDESVQTVQFQNTGVQVDFLVVWQKVYKN